MGMSLGMAGALSGGGKGLLDSLGEIQKFSLAEHLENKRAEIEDKRQARMLDAQRAMHRETIAAAAAEGKLTRGSHEKIAEAANQIHKDVAEINRKSAETIAEKRNQSEASIAGLNRTSQETIHAADRILKKYEIDLTASAHTQTSYATAIREIGYEIGRIYPTLKDPLLDPKDKAEILDRLHKLESRHDLYTKALLPPGTPSTAAAQRPEKKNPFGTPPDAPNPSAAIPGPGSTSVTPSVQPIPDEDAKLFEGLPPVNLPGLLNK